MSYKLAITGDAGEDIARHRRSGEKKALKRLARILDELREHPTKVRIDLLGRITLPDEL